MTWHDTQSPTVSWSGQPSRVGPASRVAPTLTDNSGSVATVVFFVDDRPKPQAGFEFRPVVGDYVHGQTYKLKAVAADAAGNTSMLQDSPVHEFTVDAQTGLTGVMTPPPHTRVAPAIAFQSPADVAPQGVTCRTKRDGAVLHTLTDCHSPYRPPADVDGKYQVEFDVRDDVGNVALSTSIREFIRDQGEPNLAIHWPVGSGVVPGPFTPLYTVSDGFTTPPSRLAVRCSFDGGAFRSCARLAPPDGRHTLTVMARDLAGNERRISVPLTYDATAPAVSLTGGPAEGEVVYARRLAFSFATRDATPTRHMCRLDARPLVRCSTATGHELTALTTGIHTFVLRVVDAAGHLTEISRRFAVGDRPAPRLDVGVTHSWWLWDDRTSVRRLSLTRLPRGAEVRVRCIGRGCPLGVRRITASKRIVSLTKLFKGRKLRTGAAIEIRVTMRGRVGRLFRYVMRSDRREPARMVRCLPPGARKPTKCG
jgi:hypothetical protein